MTERCPPASPAPGRTPVSGPDVVVVSCHFEVPNQSTALRAFSTWAPALWVKAWTLHFDQDSRSCWLALQIEVPSPSQFLTETISTGRIAQTLRSLQTHFSHYALILTREVVWEHLDLEPTVRTVLDAV
jgi:hypothetical protein